MTAVTEGHANNEEDWTLYYVEIRGNYMLFYQITNPNMMGPASSNMSSRSASTSSLTAVVSSGASPYSSNVSLPAPFYSSQGSTISRPGSPSGNAGSNLRGDGGSNAFMKGGFSKVTLRVFKLGPLDHYNTDLFSLTFANFFFFFIDWFIFIFSPQVPWELWSKSRTLRAKQAKAFGGV
jgi:hypothetical protein